MFSKPGREALDTPSVQLQCTVFLSILRLCWCLWAFRLSGLFATLPSILFEAHSQTPLNCQPSEMKSAILQPSYMSSDEITCLAKMPSPNAGGPLSVLQVLNMDYGASAPISCEGSLSRFKVQGNFLLLCSSTNFVGYSYANRDCIVQARGS